MIVVFVFRIEGKLHKAVLELLNIEIVSFDNALIQVFMCYIVSHFTFADAI